MFDYDLTEAQMIIKESDPNLLEFDGHIFKNWFERDYTHEYVAECLFSKTPLGIVKTMENRFKLIYPHNKNDNLDLYIIIEIDDYKNIKVVTAYTFNKKRRERLKER